MCIECFQELCNLSPPKMNLVGIRYVEGILPHIQEVTIVGTSYWEALLYRKDVNLLPPIHSMYNICLQHPTTPPTDWQSCLFYRSVSCSFPPFARRGPRRPHAWRAVLWTPYLDDEMSDVRLLKYCLESNLVRVVYIYIYTVHIYIYILIIYIYMELYR